MPKRAGITRKVSLSVNVDDFEVIEQRAKRLHGGNVSAVFADLIATIKRQEAWGKALAWYGRSVATTDAEREAIDRELLGERPPQAGAKRRGAR